MQTLGYRSGNAVLPADSAIKDLIFSQLSDASRCMWDVGAGSGQIAIEWQKRHPACHVIAIENDDACVRAIRENAAAHGTPNISIMHRDVTAGLADLAQPDAIYHGCVSWTDVNLCPVLWDRLAPGGTIVAVVGQERGRRYIHEAQSLLGGTIDRAGEGPHRFQFWAASKPLR